MSTFFLGSADSRSPHNGRDSKRSHSAKKTNTASGCLRRDSGRLLPTPTSRDWRSGKASIETMAKNSRPLNETLESQSSPISETSTAPDTGGQLSLPGASPASLSALPGSGEARRITASSGRKCCALLKKPGPVGSLVKMLLASPRWGNKLVNFEWTFEQLPETRTTTFMRQYSHDKRECCSIHSVKTLRKSVTRSSRLLFRLRQLEPIIGDTESGLLPQMAATPASWDCKGATGGGQGRSLRTDIHDLNKMIPTPRMEGFDAGRHRGKADSVHAAVKMLPTPHASCSTGPGTQGREGGENLQTKVGKRPGLKLQPAFVEYLMGFPIGWTDLKPLETR